MCVRIDTLPPRRRKGDGGSGMAWAGRVDGASLGAAWCSWRVMTFVSLDSHPISPRTKLLSPWQRWPPRDAARRAINLHQAAGSLRFRTLPWPTINVERLRCHGNALDIGSGSGGCRGRNGRGHWHVALMAWCYTFPPPPPPRTGSFGPLESAAVPQPHNTAPTLRGGGGVPSRHAGRTSAPGTRRRGAKEV